MPLLHNQLGAMPDSLERKFIGIKGNKNELLKTSTVSS
jgi:hypothetical protein